MSFSDLHKLKKIDNIKTTILECDHLIIGNDLFALEACHLLSKKYPEENIKMIFKGDFNLELLKIKGPSSVRGTSNIEVLNNLFPKLMSETIFPETVYFKDLKLKTFCGRGKSEKLLTGEKFYTTPRTSFDIDSLFESLTNPESIQLIKNMMTHTSVKNIVKEDNIWCVHCVNGDILKSKHIYWGDGPWEFFNHYENKSEFDNDFIEFTEKTKTPSSLMVKIEFDKIVTQKRETIFIPLSYTHDWGHFIGEFTTHEKNQTQSAQFIHFLDKDHTTEEIITKQIRIFKKNLQKIIPEIKNSSSTEFISLCDKSYCDEIDDETYFNKCRIPQGLEFFGYNAPLKDDLTKTTDNIEKLTKATHFLRSVISTQALGTRV